VAPTAAPAKSDCTSTGPAVDACHDCHPVGFCRFKNRDDIDFDAIEDEVPADQEVELADDSEARLWYPLPQRKWQNVHQIVMHFSECYGDDVCKIYYCGFKGVATNVRIGTVAVTPA